MLKVGKNKQTFKSSSTSQFFNHTTCTGSYSSKRMELRHQSAHQTLKRFAHVVGHTEHTSCLVEATVCSVCPICQGTMGIHDYRCDQQQWVVVYILIRSFTRQLHQLFPLAKWASAFFYIFVQEGPARAHPLGMCKPWLFKYFWNLPDSFLKMTSEI